MLITRNVLVLLKLTKKKNSHFVYFMVNECKKSSISLINMSSIDLITRIIMAFNI